MKRHGRCTRHVKLLGRSHGVGCVDGQCCVDFTADCCCAVDPQQTGCTSCEGTTFGFIKLADYLCKCGRHLYIVEVTDRSELWKYKEVIGEKFHNAKQQLKAYGNIADVLVIVSNKVRSIEKQVREYLKGYGVKDVRLIRFGGSICS